MIDPRQLQLTPQQAERVVEAVRKGGNPKVLARTILTAIFSLYDDIIIGTTNTGIGLGSECEAVLDTLQLLQRIHAALTDE